MRGLEVIPENPSLLHALALLRVRQGRLDAALPLLGRAAVLAPENARFAYVYAVALHSDGQTKQSLAVLDEALQRNPGNLDLLFARASFAAQDGDTAAARRFAERFVQLAPNDPRAKALLPLTRGHHAACDGRKIAKLYSY
ncbi:MAG: tetratricopeptide repeat protein [Nitrococcus sp.]|nr:tetratricopeptide repeat protein [Nitrococcus sp.]